MNMSIKQKDTLVLGVGNILKKDDGAGVHTINCLLQKYPDIVEYAEIMDGGTAGIDLMEYMVSHKKVIIIDSLKADSEPGSVYRFPAEKLSGCSEIFSQHQAGLAELVGMMKLAGYNPEMEIWGIVPSDVKSDEIGLTPAVEMAAGKAAEMIYESVLVKSSVNDKTITIGG